MIYSAPSVPRNPQITAIDKTALQLQWMEPELPNGIIQYYRVSIALSLRAKLSLSTLVLYSRD